MWKAQSIYAQLAFASIGRLLNSTQLTGTPEQFKVDELLGKKGACFVSIHLQNGDLRGCIGTIEPRFENVYTEIVNNAIAAASRDSRFPPLAVSELEQIEVTVDLLSPVVDVDDPFILDPKKNGLILSDGSIRKAVLLPNLPGIDTVDEQIRVLIRKAGLQNANPNRFRYKTFTSQRFY